MSEDQTTTETPEETTEEKVDSPSDDQELSTPDEGSLETPKEEPAESTEEETPSEADESPDDIAAWMKSQNLDPAKPEDAIKIAKMFKDTQKAFHADRQEKSALREAVVKTQPEVKSDDFVDPLETKQAELEREISLLRLENAVTGFFSRNPGAKDLESEMAKIVEEKPHLANDLDTLYLVANSRQKDALAQAKEQGRQEALDAVNKKQRATAPKSSAQTQTETEPEDPFLKGFDNPEY